MGASGHLVRFRASLEVSIDMPSLLSELRSRGLLAQASDEAGLDAHLESGSRTVYCGFDPTADSLHIGNLVPLITLRRFQNRGHRPILLLGGATGMIGDPSGRSTERNLNDLDVIGHWVERIRRQAEGFLEFDTSNNPAVVVNNLDWTRGLGVIAFLRDIGKHFSVTQMMQRESVRSRLGREGEGISFTEFSYMLLQAMDYVELAERYGCTVQIGGSDQWGNILSGMDLVRRKLGQEAFALTLPLITKADGSKFGKTAEGAVWLDPAKTSPYSFFQFWLNAADADVVTFLRVFTFLDPDAIDALARQVEAAPEGREAQRQLAREVTAMTHGREAVVSAERISHALFDGAVEVLSGSDLAQLEQDGMDCTSVLGDHIGLLAAVMDVGLASSRSEARRLVQSKGVSVNGQVQTDIERELDWRDAIQGRYYLLRRGKKNWRLLVRAAG